MPNDRNDYEPIIATRPSREPPREEAQPLWRLVLALGVGLAVILLLTWWWMGRSPSDGTAPTAQPQSAAPEIHQGAPVEQEILPPARDVESSDAATGADIAQAPALPEGATEPAAEAEQPADAKQPVDAEQAATPETTPEVVADIAAPAPLSVRITSPDPQVQIELRAADDSSPPFTSKAGDVVTIAPGTYRVVASGAELEPFEQEVTFDGEGPLEYTIELCAEPKRMRENVDGLVVEQRACGSTEECESLFTILSEHADQLIKDGDFRRQQCSRWRDEAEPEGRWTLDTQCGGATLATTCRISIAEGACTFSTPRRSVRGAACPKAELE